MTTISFVTPWYGPDVPGGAEAETRRLTQQLQRAGMAVEVLTTTTRDLYADWGRGYHPAGPTVIDGIPVRRFPVQRRNRAAFNAINRALSALFASESALLARADLPFGVSLLAVARKR